MHSRATLGVHITALLELNLEDCALLEGISAVTVLPSSHQPTLDKQVHHGGSLTPSCKSLSAGWSVLQVSCSSAPPPSEPKRRSSGYPQCRLHLQKKEKKKESRLEHHIKNFLDAISCVIIALKKKEKKKSKIHHNIHCLQ